MFFRAILHFQNVSNIKRTLLTTNLRNIHDYFSCKRITSTRPDIKKQLAMDSLPDYRVPLDVIEYESGKNRSILLQDKIM